MEEKIKRLEKEIAEKLDNEQWENWQEVLKYIEDNFKRQEERYNGLKRRFTDYYDHLNDCHILTIESMQDEIDEQNKIIDLMSKELTNIIDATEEEIKECFRKKAINEL